MTQLRNPFRIRTSERIDSEELFLRMFGPGVLDLLPKDDLWTKILVLRSAPGGGKTSLLRIFTPDSLNVLYRLQKQDEFKELYKGLKDLDVINGKGPKLLGVRVSCARNYASLEDTGFDASRRERILYCLFDARIALSFLRNVMALKHLRYPEDLSKLLIGKPQKWDTDSKVPLPCKGDQLYEWASTLERNACQMIDSFLPPKDLLLEGHNVPHILTSLDPKSITIDGEPVFDKLLIMFDDLHKLTERQRVTTFTMLCELRPPIGLWIAERLEALNESQLLAPGATEGREYNVVNLEDFWRAPNKSKRFESIVYGIADRRMTLAEDVYSGSFQGFLENSIDSPGVSFEDSIQAIRTRLFESTKGTLTYSNWIKATQQDADGQLQKEAATTWRLLEILIERHRSSLKGQLMLDVALGTQELAQKEKSDVRAAAEFFWSHEFKMPYYFGVNRLASMASSNIEQFLSLAAELFEELSALRVMQQSLRLSPYRQESILRRVARQRWDDIYKSLPNGGSVQKLLEAIGSYAQSQTNRPTAPYAPGVTGIAILMSERDTLIKSQEASQTQLRSLLATAVAHNLLEPSLERRQGKKGGPAWMIMYLNRLVCVHFDLPLQYGGWRHIKPQQLTQWMNEGFRKSKKDGES